MASKNGTPLGMKCFYCFVFCLFSTGLFGQREAANWYFGKNAGLDFNSGTPVPLLDGQLDTAEGCATFSDADGNLLFYTDGITVWDRFHGIMPNGEGLFGNTSSSQAALVVPRPGSDFIYYIFTPDAIQNFNNGSSRGLNYSVVDMTRNSGRGDVIQKNVNLLPNCSEKISGVLSVSDDSIWVVTHYIDTFYAFKVDATGVVHNPVSSRIAPTIGDFNNIRGAIKFAPNGRRIAITHAIFEPEFNGLLYVYDFDQVTGKVDNATLLGDDMVYYGVEFSSNSSKLYASAKSIVDLGGIRNTRSIQILQYDLDAANVRSSQFVVGEFPSSVEIGNLAGTLQIGIDKKIYHTLPNNKLSVINAPNFGGLSADFRIFDVGLGERIPRFGLPPFIQSFFETVVEITNFCEGEPTRFTLDDPDVVQSIVWNFGDPVSGSANVSTEKNPSHVFSATGNFTVTIQITYTNGQQREFIEFVEISEPPNIIGHVALEQCDADGMDDGIASFNLSEARSLFANGNEDIMGSYFLTLDDAVKNENQLDPFDYTNTVNDQLIYARAFANSDCFQIVEITLRVKPLTDLGEYTTIQVCDQQNSILENTVQLKETRTFLTTSFPGSDIGIYDTNENAILEQNELIAEEFVFTSNERALYFRVETNNSCNFIGKLGLDFIPRPEFEGHPDAIFCSSGTTLAAATGFEDYVWSTGERTNAIEVFEAGDYSVTFRSGSCEYTQFFQLQESRSVDVKDIVVKDFNGVDNSITFNVGDSDGVVYSIDGGATFQDTNVFRGLEPGIYDTVVIRDQCTRESSTVIIGGLNAFFTPNNDGINDIWTLDNADFFPNFELSIFDRYGKLLGTFNDAQVGWDGTFGNRTMPSSNYWYRLTLESGRVVQGYFALKR